MSSFEDSDEEFEDAAFRRYAAARRRQLSATGEVAGVQQDALPYSLDDGSSETKWATLGPATSTGAVASRLQFWHRAACLEDLTVGANDTVVTGVRLWPACIGLASVLEQRSRTDRDAFSGMRALELGAGVGVSGIMLAKCGAACVTLTDNQPPILSLLRRNVAENAVGGRCRVAHLAWERPEELRMGAESLDLILGSDVVYGGPKNGLLLLEALGQIIRLYGHPGTAVLLAFGCRSRGSNDHVGFLRAARAAMYEVTHLELDEAVAAEVDDGVDVVELKLGADWEP